MSNAERIVEEFLTGKGIMPENMPSFLHPVFERDLSSPDGLPDMAVAVERIKQAIGRGEKIVVFGDYDADGIPATALLLRVLRNLGADAAGIIPLRSEGYGLSLESVERIKAAGTQLLITVDNGTAAKAEVAALLDVGIETIICDHHEPQDGHIAEALALINPKRADSQYPYRELCACALAWKLSWALCSHLQVPTDPLKWELDLVALSTVADMVPLVGENRTLVQFGLQVLQKTRNVGLQALAEVSGFDLKHATAADIGFRLAPRLNATSRMHQELLDGQNASLELLVSQDKAVAKRIVAHLQSCNAARQTLVQSHLQDAERQLAGKADQLCFVLYEPHWSCGVIGLVAGRMAETYKRPVLALAPEGEVIKGSVRSIDGISVLDLLASAESAFLRFGGHAKAGGLTMLPSELTDLQGCLQAWLLSKGSSLMDFAAVSALPDIALPLGEANLELADKLREIGPFGTGFEEPLIGSRVRIKAPRSVGTEGRHFSCQLYDGEETRKAIGFSMNDPGVNPDAWYRAEYTLQADEWQGRRTASCMLKRLVLL